MENSTRKILQSLSCLLSTMGRGREGDKIKIDEVRRNETIENQITQEKKQDRAFRCMVNEERQKMARGEGKIRRNE